MQERVKFSKNLLEVDCAAEVDKICGRMRHLLGNVCHRRGFVVGVSGGIDSSVSLALSVKAIGAEKVVALQMPERNSAAETLGLSAEVADCFGVNKFHEDITAILEAVRYYQRYDEAVKLVIPEYGVGWKSKIVLPNVTESAGYNIYSVIAQSPAGDTIKKRLTHEAYLAIVAATNFKQRIRKMVEYYYADKYNFAVIGTPNRLEYDQGFFVKLGDGAADVKPIAHLYKSQVYQLAAFLGVPQSICSRPPTTDTYSLTQGQDEFYFSLPYAAMDLCLLGKNLGYTPAEIAPELGITPAQAERVFNDIETKRTTTRYLHLPALLIDEIPEICGLRPFGR
ncbi:MAG: NAD(+) synthase [Candidatus Omnitrophica bacterium]|nr:NAD(+) synthase [Candidatus Omnitrophota bacterium]